MQVIKVGERKFGITAGAPSCSICERRILFGFMLIDPQRNRIACKRCARGSRCLLCSFPSGKSRFCSVCFSELASSEDLERLFKVFTHAVYRILSIWPPSLTLRTVPVEQIKPVARRTFQGYMFQRIQGYCSRYFLGSASTTFIYVVWPQTVQGLAYSIPHELTHATVSISAPFSEGIADFVAWAACRMVGYHEVSRHIEQRKDAYGKEFQSVMAIYKRAGIEEVRRIFCSRAAIGERILALPRFAGVFV